MHRFGLRVYYEDTDAGGVVYYANYLKFAERARTEMLRHVGFEQEALRRTTGRVFAVRHCSADYLAPARLDDELVVETRLTALGGASLCASPVSAPTVSRRVCRRRCAPRSPAFIATRRPLTPSTATPPAQPPG